jgi:F-type H+-transporting ATPase subunit gamma
LKSDSPASLRRKIGSAADLQSVVRAMKAQAAASVGQYEKAVAALGDYADSVELGLGVCFRQAEVRAASAPSHRPPAGAEIRAVVFGSDQGLVGRFNDIVVEHALSQLAGLPAIARVWAVGERVHAGLLDTRLPLLGVFQVPGSVQAIAARVDDILVAVLQESRNTGLQAPAAEVYLFYNRPESGSTYAPVGQRLLPLDAAWQHRLARRPWPTRMLAETLGNPTTTLRALVREYLFVSIFRACAESLASENASRLAAMDRADRNIDEMLGTLHDSLHRLRQAQIDEELSDVISGFKSLSDASRHPQRRLAPIGSAAKP